MRGRRPSVEGFNVRIARLTRIVHRGQEAAEKLAKLVLARDSMRADLVNRLAAQKSKLASLEAQLASQTNPTPVSETSTVTA